MKRGSSFGDGFCLTLLTGAPALAAAADAAGVNRIGVDLETLGKAQRQAQVNSRISDHTWDDLSKIAPVVRHADLFARLNPVTPELGREVEAALGYGVRVLMLPWFETAAEVAAFIGAVRGRAQCVVLIETAAAAAHVREILAVPGIDEVMLGLNDLHLQLRLGNHFQVLVSPLAEMLAGEVRQRGLPLGIGGIGRAGDDSLPIPADLVYAQYPRLGATGAWLSRSFLYGLPETDLHASVQAARRRLTDWAGAAPEALERARRELAHRASLWSPPNRLAESPGATEFRRPV